MSTANFDFSQEPYESSSDVSSELETWAVTVPAVDYIRQAFFGAISKLGFPDSYNPESEQAALYGSIIASSLYQISPPEVIGMEGLQSNITLWQRFANVDLGNAIANGFSASQIYGVWNYQNPSAIGDEVRHFVRLYRGQYRARLIYIKSPASGIGHIYLAKMDTGLNEAVIIPDVEFYAATTAFNQMLVSDFELEHSGSFYVRMFTDSKTPPSTGYFMPITCLNLERLSD